MSDPPIQTGPMLQLSEEFLRLFALNQRRIYGYIVTLLPRYADAEEVLQQTNLVLWRQFDQFRPGADFARWAFGIARNETRRFLRESNRKPVTLDDDLLEVLAETHADQGDVLAARRSALMHCLERLTHRDRELIDHCYATDTTIKEVAEQQRRPLNTVYKAVARIRRTLHECVQRRLTAEAR